MMCKFCLDHAHSASDASADEIEDVLRGDQHEADDQTPPGVGSWSRYQSRGTLR
jgi:hypothetical protein